MIATMCLPWFWTGAGYDLVLGNDGYYHTSQEQYWRYRVQHGE